MLNRRDFARVFALSGTAALLPPRAWAVDDSASTTATGA